MSQKKIERASIVSLMRKGVPFRLILVFCSCGQNRGAYNIIVGKNGDVEYELVKNSIVGRASWEDGFPLSYKVHESLDLNSRYRQKCEILIHKAIAFAIPKIKLEMDCSVTLDCNTIFFTPKFPAYIADGIPMVSNKDLILNNLMKN